MNHIPQRITTPEGTTLVILPEADYLALLDSADISAADKALADSDGFAIPSEVLDAMLDGKSPVAAWREYRSLTQAQLADATGMKQPSLARLEKAKSKLRDKTAEAIAKALSVPVWALSPED